MSVPPQEETGGFTLIITVSIQPDKYDEWLRHSWTAFKHVTAEPDCLSFEMFTVPGEANKVKWVESWSKSLESVMADQGNKEYMKSYKEVTNPMLIGEPQWELMKRFGGEWARAQEGVFQKP
ncbi:Antibiotic biosynthesis monooxygenase [Diaporthe eres]|uniref:ABM domain-containing protein n=1 Tax=Diaporthe vaccinii TaxID=105482 RepID=A0ABR4E3Y1_9PEZI|nr:Antibiotic biosynthesis monooxygenase [Diaporthe eres]